MPAASVSTENRQESYRERNFAKESLQLLASLLGVRGGLPTKKAARQAQHKEDIMQERLARICGTHGKGS